MPHPTRAVVSGVLVFALASVAAPAGVYPERASFTLPQIMGYAFPSDLIASPQGQRIAWASVQRGVRNIWIAEGPDFHPRMLTSAREEDGQELTNLSFSGDGRYIVYTRGGDHGANWPAEGNLMPNPTSSPIEPKLQIWSAPVNGAPKMIAEGDRPAPSPRGDRVAFEKQHEIWAAPLDGSQAASRLFFSRGENESPVWSPDGRMLAFVSGRGPHSYIGIYTSDSEPIRYLAPSTSQDSTPRWSADGKRIAFVRRPGRGGPAQPPLERQPQPWSLWVGDVTTGAARVVWQSPETPRGSYPTTEGEVNLQWMAGDRLAFLSYHDGWPHLYSVPAAGGTLLLLTPGDFMVEFVSVTPDRRFVIYNANTGSETNDSERRHLFKVAADAAAPAPLTSGQGIEWMPIVTSDGNTLAYLGSDPHQPPMVYIRQMSGGPARALDRDRLPSDFPVAQLITPEHVTFKAPDGVILHGQLFRTAGGDARRPAIVFVHGGPPRQMLLGWHYMFYYANSYAVNQYLASRGFTVLSVNYRLGIGYGFDFHQPARAGARGASEYQDVLAGGKYLQSRADVDSSRVGIWGGSYGGYLVALALGRNSDVFAAGVDIHGVHTWVTRPTEAAEIAASVGDGVTRAELDEAARVAWEASPASSVRTWRSPVLLIHGDDDRNVQVDQTVDLVQRLKAQGIRYEERIIPDDIHDFLLYRTWLIVNPATADFFERQFKPSAPTSAKQE